MKIERVKILVHLKAGKKEWQANKILEGVDANHPDIIAEIRNNTGTVEVLGVPPKLPPIPDPDEQENPIGSEEQTLTFKEAVEVLPSDETSEEQTVIRKRRNK